MWYIKKKIENRSKAKRKFRTQKVQKFYKPHALKRKNKLSFLTFHIEEKYMKILLNDRNKIKNENMLQLSVLNVKLNTYKVTLYKIDYSICYINLF